MRLENVNVKNRIKFENLGLLCLISSIIFGLTSFYFFTVGQADLSNQLAKDCLFTFMIAWLLITYGQHAKNHKKIIIKVMKKENYEEQSFHRQNI